MIDESQNIEYKESWRDEYLKWISGFANAQGGKIYIGVNDSHDVVGVDDSKKLMEDIPNKIVSQLGIICAVNLLQENDLHYIEIIVEPSNVPISYRGKYHFRSGSTKQELNGVALQQFILKKMGRSWDDMFHETATIDAIDRNAVDYFLKKGINSKRIEKDELYADTQTVLENLNLIGENGEIRNAALLLFGKKPGRYFPCVEFKIGRFGANESDLITQDVVEGNLVEMADKVMKVLKGYYLKSYIHYKGLQRIETFELPEDALREIIYNAIAHKDYTGAPIQMHVYDDHIEVWNEGELPDGYTPETLMRQHSSRPRNKNIAYTMFKAGYIESWGRGYKKIREGFEAVFQPVPSIEVIDGGVKVTIQRQPAEVIVANAERMDRMAEMRDACIELTTNLHPSIKTLITSIVHQELKASEILHLMNLQQTHNQLTTNSKHLALTQQGFAKQVLSPALNMGLIEMLYPDSPRHPRQKYRLTELGLGVLAVLSSKTDK